MMVTKNCLHFGAAGFLPCRDYPHESELTRGNEARLSIVHATNKMRLQPETDSKKIL